MRIRDVEDAARAVHEGVGEEIAVVCREAQIDEQQRSLALIADGADVGAGEAAVGGLLDEPELRRERRAGDRPVVPRLQRPTDLEWRAGHGERLEGLPRVEV